MYIKYMFLRNSWLWIHILAGGILVKILSQWFSAGVAVVLLIVLAIAWEALEFIISKVEENYGSKERFFLDALGDIIGAVTMGIIVVY
ncbi:hypothetical protein B1H10_07705 [candidate division KSB1 bacterium 4484_188]|nr:MAG: hypothetical protein B1H10_07705 [candidate division KSB1 bacterium 4484_188]